LKSSSFNDLSLDWIKRTYGRDASASSHPTHISFFKGFPEHEESRLDWGNRRRLTAKARQKKLRASLSGEWHCLLTDLEVLELILTTAISPPHAKTTASALMGRFRTFGGVLSADVHELAAFDKLGEAGAAALKLAELTVARMTRDAVAIEPEYSSYSTLIPYLKARMGHLRIEQLRAMFMNGACRLIADEVLQEGSIRYVHIDPRQVAKRCLELDATGVIIIHNHPGGSWKPSMEDNRCTTAITEALSTLGIAFHDHIIVGKSGCFSYRGNKLMTDQNLPDAARAHTEEASAERKGITSQLPTDGSTETGSSLARESTREAHRHGARRS
jgi:DNA repair protein RadC